jgi:hypothetical protein
MDGDFEFMVASSRATKDACGDDPDGYITMIDPPPPVEA